ncbi:hypothetical protein EG68_04293 [Paragonimus skrjabini miyazakii]|uniref:Uncharacterized protein n=1 Tax=Paragonimus skrjabini miyazakii TaxID=59628 RepID=A0A8S9Z1X7_9TREM|nr:hypothetical protein EG68_04293 [Paragonimus skrjabini miyazakii]
MARVLFIFCLILMTVLLNDVLADTLRSRPYRGPQSYPGYRPARPVRPLPPYESRRPVSRPYVPQRADISDVKLYGPRRNDAKYREGLSEMAGLMDI